MEKFFGRPRLLSSGCRRPNYFPLVVTNAVTKQNKHFQKYLIDGFREKLKYATLGPKIITLGSLSQEQEFSVDLDFHQMVKVWANQCYKVACDMLQSWMLQSSRTHFTTTCYRF